MPRGTPFKTGNKMGKGAKPLTDEQKEIRATLRRSEAITLLGKYCLMDYPSLKEFIKKAQKGQVEGSTCLDLLVARVLESGIAKADLQKLDWFVSRLFPKEVLDPTEVPQVVVSFAGSEPTMKLRPRTDREKQVLRESKKYQKDNDSND